MFSGPTLITKLLPRQHVIPIFFLQMIYSYIGNEYGFTLPFMEPL